VQLSAILPLPVSVADNRVAVFAPLAGVAPLARVVRAMVSAVAEPRRVVVAVVEPLVDDVRETLVAHNYSTVSIAVASVGGTRAQCLSAALDHLHHVGPPATHVLVGDIARPLVSVDLQNRVTDGLRSGGDVVMPALVVTDSVKAVDSRGAVTRTVDRSTLRAAQFPRGLAVDQLSELLARHGSGEFDEISEALRADMPITVVEGDADGFRADLPRDAQFVEAIIARRPGLRDW
jgi:2-C-methyl-D-erythritol 4-phosphate cytidylyltransferase